MKKKNIIYSLIFSIVFLIGIVAIVSYGYIGSRGQVTGISNLAGDILNPAEFLSISGDTNFSLNITLDNLSVNDSKNNGESYIDDTKKVDVSIYADPSLYIAGIKCEYSIYYEPTAVYNASKESISKNLVELGFVGSGKDANQSGATLGFNPKSISGLTSKTLLYTGTIESDKTTGRNTHSWDLSYRFYNLDVNQVDAIGQKPSGKIIIEGGKCSSGKTFAEYIASLDGTTQGDGVVVDEKLDINHSETETNARLEQTDYTVVSNDATYPWAWDATNKNWYSTNSTTAAKSTTANLELSPVADGYYEICHNVNNNSWQRIYLNDVIIANNYGSNETKCVYIGKIKTSDKIKYYADRGTGTSTSYTYILKAWLNRIDDSNINNESIGARFEGKNPNNYVQFNGELWRVIGSFDENTHGVANSKMVKLIKADSIGIYAFDMINGLNNFWDSSIKDELDLYYYSIRRNGLTSTSRDMVEFATWYTGGLANNTLTPEFIYQLEQGPFSYTENRNVSGENYIGLISVSDYFFASPASICPREKLMGNAFSAFEECYTNDWLRHSTDSYFSITPLSGWSSRNFVISSGGAITCYTNGNLARTETYPSLYLKSDVSVLYGNGTKENPYIISGGDIKEPVVIQNTTIAGLVSSLEGQDSGDGSVVREDATIISSDATFADAPMTYQVYSSSYVPMTTDDNINFTGGNTTSKTSSFSKFYPKEAGFYNICYSIPASAYTSSTYRNYFTFYIPNSTSSAISTIYSNYNSGSTKKGCYFYPYYMTPSDYVLIKNYYYDKNVTIHFQKSTNILSSTSIRYEGKNPNNYVLFNNELWRIIGNFDNTFHGIAGESLTKIVRSNALYPAKINTSNSADWNSSSISDTLNNSYYMQKGSYAKIGISSKYRNMIEKVNWHMGGTSTSYHTPSSILVSDLGHDSIFTNKTASKHIGLVLGSDFGYAVKESDCSRNLMINYYGVAGNELCYQNNWLSTVNNRLTMSYANTNNSQMLITSDSAKWQNWNADTNVNIYPALYLKSNVKVTGGTGAMNDPYILSM